MRRSVSSFVSDREYGARLKWPKAGLNEWTNYMFWRNKNRTRHGSLWGSEI